MRDRAGGSRSRPSACCRWRSCPSCCWRRAWHRRWKPGWRLPGAPIAIVGVIIAAIVLLPETAAAVRAAARNRLQASINLALGSAVASIGLAVPSVALVSFWIGQPLELGISAGASVLMALGFVVAIITYGTGRTNLLSGIVHLVLLATYVFTVFAP